MDIQINRQSLAKGALSGITLSYVYGTYTQFTERAALLLAAPAVGCRPNPVFLLEGTAVNYAVCAVSGALIVSPPRHCLFFSTLLSGGCGNAVGWYKAVVDSLPPPSLTYTAPAIATSWHFFLFLRAQILFVSRENFGACFAQIAP